MGRIYLTIVATVCALWPSTSVADPAPNKGSMQFSCSLSQEIPAIKRLAEYYTEAFASIGYQFSMRHRPSRRSLAEASSGAFDGECARVVSTLDKRHLQYLSPIDVVIGTTTINIWSKDSESLTLDDLAQPDKTVCYVESNYAARYWLQQIRQRYPSSAPTFYKVNNYATAARMLAFDRLNHCIGVQVAIRAAAQEANLGSQIHDSGVLGQIDAQPLLHVKHRDLNEPFTRALEQVVKKYGPIETR